MNVKIVLCSLCILAFSCKKNVGGHSREYLNTLSSIKSHVDAYMQISRSTEKDLTFELDSVKVSDSIKVPNIGKLYLNSDRAFFEYANFSTKDALFMWPKQTDTMPGNPLPKVAIDTSAGFIAISIHINNTLFVTTYVNFVFNKYTYNATLPSNRPPRSAKYDLYFKVKD